MKKDHLKFSMILVSGLMLVLFLFSFSGNKADATFTNLQWNANLIDHKDLFQQIGRGDSWTLKVNAINPPFGTDEIKVSVDGPYGSHDYKWVKVKSQTTTVKLKIPEDDVPMGAQYKLCVQTGTIDALLGSNCHFMYRNSDNIELNYDFPR
ncbi:MAG: hypothetical protein ACPKPY_06015 [Nitrososphaeraceae archaeon]